ncbi:glycosyltransferase family 4 protein [Alteromonas gilva]|uniref:Glycosyltransferase family 4 protein n=1 Tax=Alteromonas gilva TaxID=2987522 RepID=A0ABT5KZC0_9ALTE|nr:glycosyltransferase family 4 protein [Alteromonas gilva]MDC8829551.1 glycosyltransferase family 4 protein [Alteromonas gilva]
MVDKKPNQERLGKKTNVALVANLYPTTEKPYFGTFIKHIEECLKSEEIELHRHVLPEYGKGLLGYLKFYFNTYISLLKFNGIVYVHYVSHSVLPALLALITNRKIKLVLNYHGSDAFPELGEKKYKTIIKKSICKIANHNAKLIIAPSNWFKQKLTETYGLEKNKIKVSYSGGVQEKIFKSKFKDNENTIKCVFAGRMIKEKGALVAAECIIEAKKKGFELEATFIGSGPVRKQLQLSLQDVDGIKFCDQLSQHELSKIFQESDIFLFPSSRKGESLGLVVAEAAICGCLPYVVKNGAVEEMIIESLQYQCIVPLENYIANFPSFLKNYVDNKEKFLTNMSFYEKFKSKHISIDLKNIMVGVDNEKS